MATVRECAKAFKEGKPAKSHNSEVKVFPGGVEYHLRGNVIAHRPITGQPSFNWCGWYDPITANHLNAIICCYIPRIPRLVSYKAHRDDGIGVFTLDRFN